MAETASSNKNENNITTIKNKASKIKIKEIPVKN